MLGEIDTNGTVTNALGRIIGTIHESQGILKDVQNNTFISITEDGRIENGQIVVVGTAKPYRPYLFRILSAYLWFFDPAFALNGHFSLLTKEAGKAFAESGPSPRFKKTTGN